MIIECRECGKDVNTKGLSFHLKTHNLKFIEYVETNLDQFPHYKKCPVCGKICTGTSCSRKCRAILQSEWQKGRVGWSKGLTKDEHPGLARMAEKAANRKGVNIWDRMDEETYKEAKRKLSEKAKINNKGENNPMFGKTHTPEALKKIFQNFGISKPEQMVMDYLNENDIEYQYQYYISDSGRTGAYDFKLKGKNILIEVDGDYWHGGPGVNKHCPQIEQIRKRDKIKNKLAQENGYNLRS